MINYLYIILVIFSVFILIEKDEKLGALLLICLILAGLMTMQEKDLI